MTRNICRRWVTTVVLCGAVLIGPALAAQVPTAVKDGWITMKIHADYMNEEALDGSNIDVDTKQGVVTLSGTVPTAAARAKAVAEAKAHDGVKNVVDNLTIGPSEKAIDAAKPREEGRTTGRYVTDGYAKSAIYAKFLTETSLEDHDIDVDIKNGAVTLNGTVRTAAAKARAVELAKTTAGVKSVTDNLRVGT